MRFLAIVLSFAITLSGLAALTVKDRVVCDWRAKGPYYPGTIKQKRGDRLFIVYDDGGKENTHVTRCKPIGGVIAKGSRVACNWKKKGPYYLGKVTGRRGASVSLLYDDGYKENTHVKLCFSLKTTGGGAGSSHEQKLAQILGADNVADGVDKAYGEDIKNYINGATEKVYGKKVSQLLGPATDGIYDSLKDNLIKKLIEKGEFNKSIFDDMGGQIIDKYKEKIKELGTAPIYDFIKNNSLGKACSAVKTKLARKAAANNIPKSVIVKVSAKIDAGCEKAWEKAKEWFEAKAKKLIEKHWPTVKKKIKAKLQKSYAAIKKAASKKQGATQSPIALDFVRNDRGSCYWNIRVNTKWCQENSSSFKLLYYNPFMKNWSETRLSCKYGLDKKYTSRQRKTSPVKVELKTRAGEVYYSNVVNCPGR